MIRVREYSCGACGHRFEVFAKDHVEAELCPECGSFAKQQLSAPRTKLEGTTGSFPGAAMAWERKRAQKLAVEQRRKRDHGDDGWT